MTRRTIGSVGALVVIDFETAACLRDPLEPSASGLSGRIRASVAWTAGVRPTTVDLDPGFPAFVSRQAGAGAQVVVVSDGVGPYAEEACASLPVTLYANRVDPATGDLTFPHVDRCCACSTCGICKQSFVKEARRAGTETILMSGRASDHKAALLASRVVARGELAAWCEAAGLTFTAFRHLDEPHLVSADGLL